MSAAVTNTINNNMNTIHGAVGCETFDVVTKSIIKETYYDKTNTVKSVWKLACYICKSTGHQTSMSTNYF